MPSAIPRQNASPAKSHVQRDATSYCVMQSPVGRILLAGNARALTHLSFQDGRHPTNLIPGGPIPKSRFNTLCGNSQNIFPGNGKRSRSHLPRREPRSNNESGRLFRTIPYGRTLSYGQIAKAIGKPKAARAVGAANGQNPVSIIVPCHRVIGSNGKLVGYGGGLSIKEALLAHESKHHP